MLIKASIGELLCPIFTVIRLWVNEKVFYLLLYSIAPRTDSPLEFKIGFMKYNKKLKLRLHISMVNIVIIQVFRQSYNMQHGVMYLYQIVS